MGVLSQDAQGPLPWRDADLEETSHNVCKHSCGGDRNTVTMQQPTTDQY